LLDGICEFILDEPSFELECVTPLFYRLKAQNGEESDMFEFREKNDII